MLQESTMKLRLWAWIILVLVAAWLFIGKRENYNPQESKCQAVDPAKYSYRERVTAKNGKRVCPKGWKATGCVDNNPNQKPYACRALKTSRQGMQNSAKIRDSENKKSLQTLQQYQQLNVNQQIDKLRQEGKDNALAMGGSMLQDADARKLWNGKLNWQCPSGDHVFIPSVSTSECFKQKDPLELYVDGTKMEEKTWKNHTCILAYKEQKGQLEGPGRSARSSYIKDPDKCTKADNFNPLKTPF